MPLLPALVPLNSTNQMSHSLVLISLSSMTSTGADGRVACVDNSEYGGCWIWLSLCYLRWEESSRSSRTQGRYLFLFVCLCFHHYTSRNYVLTYTIESKQLGTTDLFVWVLRSRRTVSDYKLFLSKFFYFLIYLLVVYFGINCPLWGSILRQY